MFLRGILLILSIIFIFKFCDGRTTGNGCTYEYVGCYKDKIWNRAYDKDYAKYRGKGEIQWEKPCTDYTNVVDGCCETLMNIYTNKHYFGVQFHGECWTYEQADSEDYNKHGASTQCLSRDCTEDTKDMIGKGYTNAIYCAYECGTSKIPVQTRIVNGQEAASHYPFIASLQYGGVHFCGATLISCRWLLTAAHCFKSGSGGGELSVLPNEYAELGHKHLGNGTIYKYDKVFLHSQYHVSTLSSGYTQYDYDVALLRLVEIPAMDGETIQPVCLDNDDVLSSDSPTDPDWEGNSYTVAGWGSTRLDPGTISPDLRDVDTPQVSQLQCPGNWNDRKACFTTGPAQPSAQPPQQGRGSCAGDGGGPYFYEKNGRYVQVALVSTGKTFNVGGQSYCAEPSSGHEGTKVDHPDIRTWIEATMKAN